MKISVIIPTYNRLPRLKKTLAHLENQTLPKDQFEIIVVNDGSTDQTAQFLSQWQTTINFHHYHQVNGGAGSARNLGIKHAHHPIILFIGDDIYTTKNFLQTHQHFHQLHPQANHACLGLTDWYTPTCNTPFMQWLTNGGHQFAYHHLQSGHPPTYKHFYTSNISLKKSLLQKETFSEDFTVYGWEDIELAYRLQEKHQLKISFQKEALAYHDDPVDLERFQKRMLNIGRSARIFQKLHPQINLIPKGKKLLAYHLLTNPITRFIARSLNFSTITKKYYWYILMKYWFLKGTKQ